MNDLRPSKLGIAVRPLAFQAANRFCIDLANRSESVLLAYARKRLEQLTKELSSYQAEEQKRLDHSLKVQREEDAKLTELKLKQESERMMAEFETSLKKKVGKLKSDTDTDTTGPQEQLTSIASKWQGILKLLERNFVTPVSIIQ